MYVRRTYCVRYDYWIKEWTSLKNLCIPRTLLYHCYHDGSVIAGHEISTSPTGSVNQMKIKFIILQSLLIRTPSACTPGESLHSQTMHTCTLSKTVIPFFLLLRYLYLIWRTFPKLELGASRETETIILIPKGIPKQVKWEMAVYGIEVQVSQHSSSIFHHPIHQQSYIIHQRINWFFQSSHLISCMPMPSYLQWITEIPFFLVGFLQLMQRSMTR